MTDREKMEKLINEELNSLYNTAWDSALDAVYDLIHTSYFVDGKPALVIQEDNSQRPALDIFDLINTLKK